MIATSELGHSMDFLSSVCPSCFWKSSLFCCLQLHLVGHSRLLLFLLGESVGQLMYWNVLQSSEQLIIMLIIIIIIVIDTITVNVEPVTPCTEFNWPQQWSTMHCKYIHLIYIACSCRQSHVTSCQMPPYFRGSVRLAKVRYRQVNKYLNFSTRHSPNA